MNEDRRLNLTLDRWREENGFAPLEAKVIDFPLKPKPTVAYRVGYGLGVALVVVTVIGILAGVAYLMWRLV